MMLVADLQRADKRSLSAGFENRRPFIVSWKQSKTLSPIVPEYSLSINRRPALQLKCAPLRAEILEQKHSTR